MNDQDNRALLEECMRLNGEIRMASIGTSMWPDIRSGDELRLTQIGFEAIAPGDIVLYHNERTLVAHRVLKTYLESGRAMLVLKGDNRTFADPPIFYEQVVGRVEEASRSGKVVYARARSGRGRRVAWRSHLQDRFWHGALDLTLGKPAIAAETLAVYQLVACAMGWVAVPELAQDLDWEKVYAFAHEGRLTAALSHAPLPGAPDWFQARCVADLRENQAHHVLLYQQLEQLLAAFADAGLPVMVIKGPVNADFIYANPSWRPMVDIDLLVKDADWAASVAVLTELGFTAESSRWSGLTEELTGQVAMLKSVGPAIAAVELHRDLKILSERLAVEGEVSLPRAWADARPYETGSVKALTLSPEDTIAYCSTHWAQHHFFSSIWLLDIALMASQPTLNWDKLVRQAHQDGTAHFLWSTLFLSQSLWAAPVPPEVLTALQPPLSKGTVIRHLLWEKTLSSFHEQADARSLLLQLMLFKGWRRTLSGLFWGVFPSGAWLAQHYEPETVQPSKWRLRVKHWRHVCALLRG